MSLARQESARPVISAVLDAFRGECDRAKSKRGAAFAFSIRIASAALAFLSQALLARWIGGFEYGIFAYVWVWMVILGPILTLGFNSSVVRFIPEYKERAEWPLLRGLLRGSRAVVLAAAGLASLASFTALLTIDGLVESYFLLPFLLLFVALPAYALTDLHDGVGRAQSWIDLALVPPYIVRPLLLLGLMLAAVLAGLPADAKVAVAAAAAATWVTAIAQYLLIDRRMSGRATPGPRAYRFGFWVRVSLPLLLLDGFGILLHSFDVLILKAFVAPPEIAVYYAAARTTSLIAFVHFAVTAVFWTRFSEYHSAGRVEDLRRAVRDAATWTFWPSVLAAAGVLAMGLPLLMLFGTEFTSGYPVMFVLAIGFLARAAVGPCQGLLNMLGHQNISAVILGGALAVNVALNLLLIPRFGLIGAAAATSAAFVLESILLFVLVKRRLGLHGFIFGIKPRAV